MLIVNEYPDGFHSIQCAFMEAEEAAYQAGEEPEEVTYQAGEEPEKVTYQAGEEPEAETGQAGEVSEAGKRRLQGIEGRWIYVYAEKWIQDLLVKLYAAYGDSHVLTSEIRNCLAVVRGRSSEIFHFVLRELLSWSADADDMESFTELLEMAEDMGIGRAARPHSACDFSQYELPYSISWNFPRRRSTISGSLQERIPPEFDSGMKRACMLQ